MRRIYLDNGSTSFPKAPGVGSSMAEFIDHIGVNIARGGYAEAYSTAETVLETREMLCRLFGFDKAENVIFQSGVTAALNLLLRGFLQSGDRVVTTSMEHNAVLRPLYALRQKGIQTEVLPCLEDGSLPLELLEEALRSHPKLLVMTHASNVCGTVLPIREAASLCRQYGVRMIVDSAQSGGVLPIEMKNWGIDAVAFAGHKGLLGPQGIGGFLISDDFSAQIDFRIDRKLPYLTKQHIARFYARGISGVVEDWLSENSDISAVELYEGYRYLMVNSAVDLVLRQFPDPDD